MSILVTGGCGYVGSRLVEALLERTDHRVDVVDTTWFGNYLSDDPRLAVIQHDIRTADLDLAGYDTIFHLAGIANDPAADLNPLRSWEVNVLATLRLVDRAARQGVRHFVFPSSGAVYGVRSEPRVTEDLDLMPISDYNKTKMVAERVVLSYAGTMVTTIFRPATVCGWSRRMRLDLTVNALTMQALTNGRMTVFGGMQVRPHIHIDDLVDLFLVTLERRLSGVFNAGFENLTVREIADLVAVRIPAEIVTSPSNDPRSYRLCSDRLCAAGFKPLRGVAVAIDQLADAFDNGRLTDNPAWHSVQWMKEHSLG
jgi:nucleoside-diphosphate-sugar epimerase